jgi:long-chain acyl-CoA synthetase
MRSAKGDKYDWISYAEFGQRVERMRIVLKHHGVGKGDKVALIRCGEEQCRGVVTPCGGTPRPCCSPFSLSPCASSPCISNNRVEWAVIFYATASVGGALVPMYEAQMEKDWKYIISDR